MTTDPMQRWLFRLSYSFFILAGLLVWEIVRIRQGRYGAAPEWRIALYTIGAAMAFSLGVMGVRARHRDSSR